MTEDSVPITESTSSSNVAYYNTTSATWPGPIDNEGETEKKGMFMGMPPTTFAELDKMREMAKEKESAVSSITDFMSLAGNVIEIEEDVPGGIRKLAAELVKRLHSLRGSDDEEMDDEEMDDELKATKETWTAAYKNDLSDASFLFIESGGGKDGEGKTTPRSLRHLPYKDKNGKVDLPHLRNAISRLGQDQTGKDWKGFNRESILKKAQKILEQNRKSTSPDMRFDLSKTGFTVWKDDSGTWRWLGVYSNKFRDDDKPVREIIAEKAHIEFIDRVNSGELKHPDLYVWHIPVPVGKADLLAYDDSGFAVASGTFNNEKVALALQATKTDLAMSHGMPAEFIVRDKDDQSVITRYVSSEVSVLSRDAAANKRTHFTVLAKEEKNMALQPELREKVAEMLGEEATLSIENQLQEEGKKAAAEVDFKQQGEEKEVEEQADTTGSETTETESAAGETASAVGDAGETQAGGDTPLETEVKVDASELQNITGELKKELAEVLGALVKVIDDSNTKFSERLDALEQKVGEFSKSEDERFTEKAAGMTTASLASLIAKVTSGQTVESVIGNPATHVHGNSKLAKEAPEESEKATGEEPGGLFFQSWRGY